MKNKLVDLRDHLFATIEALRDTEKPMEIARGKAIAEVAQVIINSAKVEVDYINAAGGQGSGFIPKETPEPLPGPTPGSIPRLVSSIGNGKEVA
jgi:hypothetical protein